MDVMKSFIKKRKISWIFQTFSSSKPQKLFSSHFFFQHKILEINFYIIIFLLSISRIHWLAFALQFSTFSTSHEDLSVTDIEFHRHHNGCEARSNLMLIFLRMDLKLKVKRKIIHKTSSVCEITVNSHPPDSD